MNPSTSLSIVVPVILGLVLGIAFMIALAYSVCFLSTRKYLGSGELSEFIVPNELPEVKLLFDKYPANEITEGFSRNEDRKIIQFDYIVPETVDTDGDGYRESPRHLDLMLTYDESGGTIDINPNAKLMQMKVRCTQPSPSDFRTYIDIFRPAQYGKVMGFIQNAKCIF